VARGPVLDGPADPEVTDVAYLHEHAVADEAVIPDADGAHS
jgi:hypothetical protein